jgi:predicted CoA-binding protein
MTAHKSHGSPRDSVCKITAAMPFQNPPLEKIQSLLRTARTIAVVGLSDDPQRPSYEVASALLEFGYRLIPVNPALAAWKGLRAVPDLDRLQQALAPGERIDIVNVFRRPEHVGAVIEDCIRLKMPAVWLQPGVVDAKAAQRAAAAGVVVVMDRCIKVDRMQMG